MGKKERQTFTMKIFAVLVATLVAFASATSNLRAQKVFEHGEVMGECAKNKAQANCKSPCVWDGEKKLGKEAPKICAKNKAQATCQSPCVWDGEKNYAKRIK